MFSKQRQGVIVIMTSVSGMEGSSDAPTISMWLDRGREAEDVKKVNELIEILKDDIELPQASVKVEYQSGNEKDETILEEY